MTRSRKAARDAGTAAERLTAQWLAAALDDDRIERRSRNGAKDRGDVGGVRVPTGERLVIECKNTAALDLAGWVREAEVERGNDDAVAGVVVHKRRGTSDPGDWYVTCTLRDLAAILTGERPA